MGSLETVDGPAASRSVATKEDEGRGGQTVRSSKSFTSGSVAKEDDGRGGQTIRFLTSRTTGFVAANVGDGFVTLRLRKWYIKFGSVIANVDDGGRSQTVGPRSLQDTAYKKKLFGNYNSIYLRARTNLILGNSLICFIREY